MVVIFVELIVNLYVFYFIFVRFFSFIFFIRLYIYIYNYKEVIHFRDYYWIYIL